MSGVQCEFDSQSISCFIRRLELILIILFIIIIIIGTAWGDPMRQHHPEQKIDKEPVFGNARILAATSEDSQRKLREAI